MNVNRDGSSSTRVSPANTASSASPSSRQLYSAVVSMRRDRSGAPPRRRELAPQPVNTRAPQGHPHDQAFAPHRGLRLEYSDGPRRSASRTSLMATSWPHRFAVTGGTGMEGGAVDVHLICFGTGGRPVRARPRRRRRMATLGPPPGARGGPPFRFGDLARRRQTRVQRCRRPRQGGSRACQQARLASRRGSSQRSDLRGRRACVS